MNSSKKICGLFMSLALIFGIIVMFLIPPFQVPDEDSHFKKAYTMAYGDFIPTIENGQLGFNISKSLSKSIELKKEIMGNRDERVSYSQLILEDRGLADYSDKEFQNFSTASSPTVAHIIPAIGMFIGRIVAKIMQGGYASATFLLYFGRFANLLFYIGMIYFSIKTIPILKKTLAAVALMPMCIFLAASLSYDCTIIACTFLATSIILKLLFDEKYMLAKKNMIILAILASIILAMKPNYVLVFLLLFVIPKEKFADIKDFGKKATIFAGMVIVGYVVIKLPGMFVSGELAQGSSLPGQQMQYMLEHPFAFFEAMWNSLMGARGYYLSTMVAVFGLIDTYVPYFLICLYIGMLVLLGISDISLNSVKPTILIRGLSIILPILSIVCVFLVMYWSWTPQEMGVGSNIVTGVQGRYFIPALVLPFLCFANTRLTKHKMISDGMTLVYNHSDKIIVASLCVSCLFMLIRYW